MFLTWRVEGDRYFDIFELVIRFSYLRAIAPLSAEITAVANSSISPFESETGNASEGSLACSQEAVEPQDMTFPGSAWKRD
ncbi:MULTISPECIES: hypothetical protein [unclassified Microcoleus]|uniref:hypothetical protein n=1 Tax=unclassified Microcoleus TaxID=2642155 RepID=UPI002FCFC8C3